MSFWMTVWVVLMILWLFGSGYVAYEGPVFNGRHFIGYSVVPWLCVLIVGLAAFGVVNPAPILR